MADTFSAKYDDSIGNPVTSQMSSRSRGSGRENQTDIGKSLSRTVHSGCWMAGCSCCHSTSFQVPVTVCSGGFVSRVPQIGVSNQEGKYVEIVPQVEQLPILVEVKYIFRKIDYHSCHGSIINRM